MTDTPGSGGLAARDTPVRVACGQFEAASGNKEANLAVMRGQAQEARDKGAGLIVFPELSVSGYVSAERIPALLEPLDGPSVTALRETARSTGIDIAFGFAASVAGQGRNSLVVVARDGSLAGAYHKVHLWEGEHGWAVPGDAVVTFTLGGITCSGWICYDTRFPEVGRAAAVAGADVSLVATAWLGPGDEWELAMRSRALDNSMFVAGADAINRDPALRCHGRSIIVSPKGHVLAQAEPGVNCVIWADLDPAELVAQRTRVPLLAHRRL